MTGQIKLLDSLHEPKWENEESLEAGDERNHSFEVEMGINGRSIADVHALWQFSMHQVLTSFLVGGGLVCPQLTGSGILLLDNIMNKLLGRLIMNQSSRSNEEFSPVRTVRPATSTPAADPSHDDDSCRAI